MTCKAEPENAQARRDYERFAALEPKLWQQVDVVYYLSKTETELVRSRLLDAVIDTPARTLPGYAFSPIRTLEPPLAARRGILLVAGFRHTPNIDGAIWFKNEVLPLIRRVDPTVQVFMVGSSPPASVQQLADATTTVTGFVPDAELERHYLQARVAVAPLRVGAGLKGKVVEAMHFGLPIVTTTVGAQGLDAANEVLDISDDAQRFADLVVKLLADDALWARRHASSKEYAQQHFSHRAMIEVFRLDIDQPDSADSRFNPEAR